jgi:hypothetical protein
MTRPLNCVAYNSWWQLRGDAWGRLEDASARIAAAAAQRRRVPQRCDRGSRRH